MYACTLLTLNLQVASCLTTSSNEPVNLQPFDPHSHAWGVSSLGVRDSSSLFSSALLAADSASNRALRSFSTFLRSSSSAASLMTAHRLAWRGASQDSESISSLAENYRFSSSFLEAFRLSSRIAWIHSSPRMLVSALSFRASLDDVVSEASVNLPSLSGITAQSKRSYTSLSPMFIGFLSGPAGHRFNLPSAIQQKTFCFQGSSNLEGFEQSCSSDLFPPRKGAAERVESDRIRVSDYIYRNLETFMACSGAVFALAKEQRSEEQRSEVRVIAVTTFQRYSPAMVVLFL